MVYLDNAATTQVSTTVVERINEVLLEAPGNPSSTHAAGRKAKILIEACRKDIAKILNCQPGEIFFTAGGTEADNMAIMTAVRDLGLKRIITSSIEHHAVLHPVEFLEEKGEVKVDYVQLDAKGNVDIDHLSSLLDEDIPTLVSLMFANNEIGNILPVKEVADLVKEKGAYFHSDMVQGFGHYAIDLQEVKVDFAATSAHKYHGPKGVGFCFIRGGVAVNSLIHGGGQERNLRAGTENVHSIVGMHQAITEAYESLAKDKAFILDLKKHLISKIEASGLPIGFNGESGNLDSSLYTVVNLKLPQNDFTGMILFQLDMEGFCVSGGSACNSGASKGSHVIEAVKGGEDQVALRVSLCKYNSREELDDFVACLEKILAPALQA
ncbi:MAG: cysteine desulfurase family protein [Schleiferiaceae bacterium]